MVPLKLELKNFLSYGDSVQTIDFSTYSLICLSGKNGNGKSALLDAITWAVWGQARKVGGISKADDGLVRLGQTRMMVALTFILNGKTYRVRREYAKTYGKPHASLDFEVFDIGINQFRSLTDKTIRATQDAIEQTINLDYETFINSAFLRQGQSNEFSKKTAKERKQILSTILGLNTYDQLQQKALAEAKKFEQQATIQKQLQDVLVAEVAQEEQLSLTQKTITLELAQLNNAIKATELMLAEQMRLLQQNEDQIKLKNFIEQQRAQLEQEFFLTAQDFKAQRKLWSETQATLQSLPQPEALEAQKIYILAQKNEQATLTQALSKLEQERVALEQKLQKLLFTLEQELGKQLQEAVFTYESLSQQGDQLAREHARNAAMLKEVGEQKTALTRFIEENNALLSQEANCEAMLQKIKAQFEKRKMFYQHCAQLGNQSKNLLKELEQKKELITCNTSRDCPLCSQPLSDTAHAQVLQDLEAQELMLNRRIKRISAVLPKLKDLLIEQNKECTELEKRVSAQTSRKATVDEKLKQLQAAEQAYAQLSAEISITAKKITQTTTTQQAAKLVVEQRQQAIKELHNDQTLISTTQALIGVNEQLAALQKNLAQLSNIDELLEKFEKLQQQITNRAASEIKNKGLKDRCLGLIVTLRSLKNRIAEYSLTLKNIQLPDLKNLQAAITKLRNEKELQEAHKAAQTLELGKVNHTLERLSKSKNEIEKIATTIKELQSEAEDYTQLAFAFGKNGIQALLIEEAVPEIEQEANDLLAKLTDNQAQIFIESLRDLKSGGVKETLEIKVADAAGIRPYEMFSGGEAFRVDFALRIAISKLLARRAGTALQTLIIDEGFGSQDEEGLTRIMSALHAIQSDFSKIIVVSHLNEFKENFPVHFIIEKTSTGSVVHIEERG